MKRTRPAFDKFMAEWEEKLSLMTGYVDILIRKVAAGYEIVGLSPAGIAWLKQHTKSSILVTRVEVGALIPHILAERLSVKVGDGSKAIHNYSEAYERRSERREP
jgi:hypothetical protein